MLKLCCIQHLDSTNHQAPPVLHHHTVYFKDTQREDAANQDSRKYSHYSMSWVCVNAPSVKCDVCSVRKRFFSPPRGRQLQSPTCWSDKTEWVTLRGMFITASAIKNHCWFIQLVRRSDFTKPKKEQPQRLSVSGTAFHQRMCWQDKENHNQAPAFTSQCSSSSYTHHCHTLQNQISCRKKCSNPLKKSRNDISSLHPVPLLFIYLSLCLHHPLF